LDSLTKHAHPLDPEETTAETEHEVQFQEPDQTLTGGTRNRGSARGALVIFLGGLLAVWLYGYMTGAYEIPYLRGVTQSPEAQVGFRLVSSNPIISGVLAASVLLGVFYIWHRRKL
jgi:hypothetical protein